MTIPTRAAAADIAAINDTAEWTGPTLAVRRQSSVGRPLGERRLGVIRNFDLASVFTEGRKMEHFSSIEELAKVWEVVRAKRPPPFK
ncbi:hypothetical protein D5400_09910 [Georhizobium profundi]|uniref:Uncharacterized protein n=2 Tax=Georhizobium profundi TaxID=2341112 RepID=A0A3S9B3V0_9HYPH|nr:hypothetical protein D5400_09910 [Georhizobium profundi]